MSLTLVNYVLYQTGWLAAVLGAAQGHPWIGTGVALTTLAGHFAVVDDRRPEWRLVLQAGALGLVVDSAQVSLGLLTFSSGTVVPWLCPPWIVVMWMQFATTFRFSLRWLMTRTSHAAAFGAIGGPLAYAIGERLGAVALSQPSLLTLAVLSAAWSLAVPALARAARGRTRSSA